MKIKEITKKEGITLIALVITILILLILAGITITAITGENGLIKSSLNAKEETEIADERETVNICTAQSMGKDKRGDIKKESLQNELDNYIGESKTEVLKGSSDELYVYFIDTNRYYDVDINGNIEGPVKVNRVEDEYPGDITKDKNGNELSGETEEEAYEINCIEDLCALSNSCNKGSTYAKKYIKLMIDLDFKSDLSYVSGKFAVEGNIPSCSSVDELKNILSTGEGFVPIGKKNNMFRGYFDGNYYTISNLYINTDDHAGLFGSCWTAVIKNIVVEGEINVRNDLSLSLVQAGGITARSRGSSFINCINYANIKGLDNKARMGGISGVEFNDGSKFINCANYGTITGTSNNSGILGWDWSTYSKIYNSLNANTTTNGIVACGQANSYTELVNTIIYGKCNYSIEKGITKINHSFYLIENINSSNNELFVGYDEQKMKSEEFVNELNSFIETKGNDLNIDTTGWAKWIYNENDFPTLDIKTIWNGTNWMTNDN